MQLAAIKVFDQINNYSTVKGMLNIYFPVAKALWLSNKG